ncbi:MAG: hypothetical protein R3B70_42890 [Polyangiaceae bacterium]
MSALLLAALLGTAAPAAAGDKPPPAAPRPPPASADDKREEAKRLFDRALALTKSYRHFEACALMERSYEMDASLNTKFWLARCKTTVGHLASASRIYKEILAALAEENRAPGVSDDTRSANERRVALVEEDLSKIVADVPTLRLQIPPALGDLKGLTLQRNGASVPRSEWTEAWSLDPGTYTITTSAPGYASASVVREVENGQQLTVSLPPLVATDVAPAPAQPGAVQRALGWTSGGLGVASLAAGGGLLIAAKLEYDGSLTGCDAVGCNAASREEQRGAALKADVATGLLLGGAAVAGAGLVLLLTAPPARGATSPTGPDAPRIQATFTPSGVGLQARW